MGMNGSQDDQPPVTDRDHRRADPSQWFLRHVRNSLGLVSQGALQSASRGGRPRGCRDGPFGPLPGSGRPSRPARRGAVADRGSRPGGARRAALPSGRRGGTGRREACGGDGPRDRTGGIAVIGLPDSVRACLFDLDGVLTRTATVHAAAWKEMFDGYLRERAVRTGQEFVPFDPVADYTRYVDGKPRYDGVRSFLTARGIDLLEGKPGEPPAAETVRGLGNRKNELVLQLIHGRGVEVYDGSVRYLEAAREAGLRCAVVSSSANTRDVLVAAGIEEFFEARIDGVVAEREELKGKPAPDTFLAGAGPRRGARRGRGLRGCARRRGGRTGKGLRLRRRRRPGRAGRGPARARREHRSIRSFRATGGLMTQHRSFPPEPWMVRETELDLSTLADREAIFALSNGHIGLRANLEEGEPHGLPGTYLNSFYETWPMPQAEAGYGYPELGQTLVNVTNGKIIRLLVDDEPFDVRYGRLRAHERVLDLRAGVLRRQAEWVSPAGQAVRVSSVRLVSFAQRAIAAILYEVEPLGAPARLVVQSELVTNEPLPEAIKDDPRASSGVGSALRSEFYSDHDARVVLVHSTKRSGLRMAAGMDHVVEGPPGTQTSAESGEDLGRVTVATELEPGQRLRLVKFLGYGWSSQRSVPAV